MGAEVIEKDQTRARERSGSWIAAFLLLHGFFIGLRSAWRMIHRIRFAAGTMLFSGEMG